MSGPVLVVGASSKLGRPIVRLLREEGRAVRAMTRTPSKAGPLRELGAEVVGGDLRDPSSLARACAGMQCAIASAHALEGRGGNEPAAVDRRGHRSLISAAVGAGVERFLFVSAYGAGPDHPLDFFRIKHETEKALESSGLAATSVRATAFMETWIEILGKMIARRGKVVLFGPGVTPINFVSVEDVARVVIAAANSNETIGRTIEVGGPENLTMTQVVDILETVTGRPIRRAHVPLGLLRAGRIVVRPLHPGMSRIMQLGILMNRPGWAYDGSATREFPFERTRFEDVARSRRSSLA